jgi:hypothetical protein
MFDLGITDRAYLKLVNNHSYVYIGILLHAAQIYLLYVISSICHASLVNTEDECCKYRRYQLALRILFFVIYGKR